MIANNEQVANFKYDTGRIRYESIILNHIFESAKPYDIRVMIQQDLLADEVDPVFNLGPTDDKVFTQIKMNHQLIPTLWTDYPQQYKFIGVKVNISDK